MSLSDKATAIANALVGEIDQALSEIASEIVAEQKRRAPRKTGALANSIKKLRLGPMQYKIIAGGSATKKDGYDYAVGQEFGNHHNPAQPFFFSSYRAKKRQARMKVQGAINKSIRRGSSSP